MEKHRAIATKPVQLNARGGPGIGNRGASSGGRGGIIQSNSRGMRGSRPPKDKMAQLAAYFV